MHPQILFAHSSLKWTTKTCSAPPVFTKLHPSYHLNSTQPDHAMWQSPPLKISQPEQATCHNPTLTKLTNQILPRHHLLHLTHETLTLIFFSPSTTMAAAAAPPHLFRPPRRTINTVTASPSPSIRAASIFTTAPATREPPPSPHKNCSSAATTNLHLAPPSSSRSSHGNWRATIFVSYH